MMNKDYILRIAERIGRALAIILRLRQFNQYDEALIAVDDLFLQTTGLTSSFINSISGETLLQMLSPLGTLNIDACLWIASLLKIEGQLYEDKGEANESYYRYVKALFLFLEVELREHALHDSGLSSDVDELLKKLEEYELPSTLQEKIFLYNEQLGYYAKAEDMLFEFLASDRSSAALKKGLDFYTRLRSKSVADLIAGNFSPEEVEEGLDQIRQKFSDM